MVFRQAIHPEDRAHIMDQLTNTQPTEYTRFLAVRLMDAAGCSVRGQLYYACSVDLDDRRQYLIGICEGADMETWGVAPMMPDSHSQKSRHRHGNISFSTFLDSERQSVKQHERQHMK
jgi:hypothetical protein